MYYYKCSKKKNILKTRRDCSCVFLPAKSPQINVPQNGVFVLASTLEKMLNNNPSVAMEYKILGNGNKVPIMLEKQKNKNSNNTRWHCRAGRRYAWDCVSLPSAYETTTRDYLFCIEFDLEINYISAEFSDGNLDLY